MLAILTTAVVLISIGQNPHGGLVLTLSVPLWIVLAKFVGLYDRDHQALRHLTLDELPRLLLWVLFGGAALTLATAIFHVPTLDARARVWLWVVLFCSAAGYRGLVRTIWRRATPPERVVVIGEGALAAATLRKFWLFRDIHVDVVGERAKVEAGELRDGTVPWLDGVDRVVLAPESFVEGLIADLLPYCRQHQIKLSVVPPARGMFGTAVQLDHIAEMPVIEYQTWDLSRSSMLTKRLIDIVVSAALLLALSPLLIVLALLVSLTSKASPLYVQDRAGVHGRPFRMYKLRTMVVGADAQLDELIDLEHLEDPMFKLEDDPRVTALGRFLRRWSLDELPQLLNVLKGDMSLVGPRPEQVDLVERYLPEHRFRLLVKPGMTGPMQVYGRGALTFEERLAVDRDYIEQPSLGRDLRILALTVAAVLRGDGAY